MKKENLEFLFNPLKLFLNTGGTIILEIECTENVGTKWFKLKSIKILNIVITNKNDIMSEMEGFL